MTHTTLTVYDADRDDEGCLRLHVNTDAPFGEEADGAISRLIAAAPDLLAALKGDVADLEDFIDEYGEFPFSIDGAKGMIRRARATIDKAEKDNNS